MISVTLGVGADVHPTVVRAVTLVKESYTGAPTLTWTHLVALSIHLDRLALSLEAAADPADPGALDPEHTPRWWRVALRDAPDRLTWYYGTLPLTSAESILDGDHRENEAKRLQVDLAAIDAALAAYGAQHWGEAWEEARCAVPWGLNAMLTVHWPVFPTVVDQGRIEVDPETLSAEEN